MKAFIHKYNWEEIKFPSENDDLKKFEKNNIMVANNINNIMFCIIKQKNIYSAHVSKHNSNQEKQLIFLLIPNGEEQPDLDVKNSSVSLREVI